MALECHACGAVACFSDILRGSEIQSERHVWAVTKELESVESVESADEKFDTYFELNAIGKSEVCDE